MKKFKLSDIIRGHSKGPTADPNSKITKPKKESKFDKMLNKEGWQVGKADNKFPYTPTDDGSRTHETVKDTNDGRLGRTITKDYGKTFIRRETKFPKRKTARKAKMYSDLITK